VKSPARGNRPGARRPGPPSPWWVGWRLSVALLAFIVVGGTAGYCLIEGWDPWDAFYMTVISVTTVGYREVHPLSRPGQAFTVALVTFGVATVL
jgi:voltage-gated potassium channel